jgi:hypothetical protein
MTLGVFVQSSRFIPQYAHIVWSLTKLTRCEKGLPVPFIWTPERQQIFDHVRNLLLDGIHLAPPTISYLFIVKAMPRMTANPTASTSSATCLREHNSPSPSTLLHPPPYTSPHSTTYTRFPTTSTLALTSHGSQRRGPRLTGNGPHSTLKRTPSYGPRQIPLLGTLFSFPLYASSDHLPLKWIRKCEKGPVSKFTIEQLSDIQWVHSYIPGPENTLFDALSRYPLLVPRVLAPVGLSDAVSQLLDSLPDSLKDAHVARVFAPPHTQKVAQQIHSWRRLTNPIDVHSLTHRSAPSPDTGLIIAVPRAKDALRIAARLLTTTIPFAVLLPSDLAPRVADADQFDGQPDLHETYKSAGKIMFLDSDQLWIVGNIPDLHHFHRIQHSQVLLRPAPLLEVFSNTLHPK